MIPNEAQEKHHEGDHTVTIDEARTLKAKMEKTIRDEVDSFTSKTGLCVKDIDVIRHMAMSDVNLPMVCMYQVIVRVEM